MDRYVRAIQDLLGQLGTPAERISAMEEVLGRFPAAETRRAAGEFVSDLAATPERMMELRRLLGEFASPGKQLRTFEEQIAITRQQLELLARQLETAESTIGQFADLAERLSALAEPFAALTSAWRSSDPGAAPGAEDDPGSDEAAPSA
jgi:methyl-accepting chemotaxis protein